MSLKKYINSEDWNSIFGPPVVGVYKDESTDLYKEHKEEQGLKAMGYYPGMYDESNHYTEGNRRVNAYVISDTMDATLHMADGKLYDSKQKFRAATKAAGCIEVGNEVSTITKPRKPVELDRGQRREALRRAFYESKNR